MKNIKIFEINDSVYIKPIDTNGVVVHCRLFNGTSTFSEDAIRYIIRYEVPSIHGTNTKTTSREFNYNELDYNHIGLD